MPDPFLGDYHVGNEIPIKAMRRRCQRFIDENDTSPATRLQLLKMLRGVLAWIDRYEFDHSGYGDPDPDAPDNL